MAGGGDSAKRVVAIALAFAAVVVFTAARPVAASNRYWATGTGVVLNLLDHCGSRDAPAEATFTANTPFLIRHGWGESPWTTDSPANKSAFMGLATYFEFRVDFMPQPSTLFSVHIASTDTQLKLFVSEYDQGMTGTHRFAGLWYLDGELVGGTPGEAVFMGGCVVNVSFV